MKLTLTDNDGTILDSWEDVENGINHHEIDAALIRGFGHIETKMDSNFNSWEVDHNGEFTEGVKDMIREDEERADQWLSDRLVKDLQLPPLRIAQKDWGWVLRNIRACNEKLDTPLEQVTIDRIVEIVKEKIKRV